MACFSPLQAYRLLHLSNPKTGKSIIRFNLPPMNILSGGDRLFEDLLLPCGRCIGCRLERSRQWAIRCMHESSLYENNCFITLTFNDDSLLSRDNPFSLDVRDFQLFIKRLRKRFGLNIRYFHCGEYGELFHRPHYHACIFNFDFPDRKLFKVNNGCRLYTSEILSDLWPFGFSSIGDVTFDSAAYVARYILKKVTGDPAVFHYNPWDLDTGEILFSKKPEYCTMSRRPGIAKEWFEQNWRDVYVHGNDSVVVKGKQVPPPRYYDRLFEVNEPSAFSDIKSNRVASALLRESDNTPHRLRVKEKVLRSRISKLPRILE